METLVIRSAQGSYPVDFQDTLGHLVAELIGVSRGIVLIDKNVAVRYQGELAPLLSSLPTLEINATEEEKTLDGCARALTFFQSANATRQTQVIAIGGGIVQDIATFCTHVYYRGLKWIYVPTTLLGMSDSCIGAKASINFNRYKNQLGVFHSPSGVRICLGFLGSLPESEIRSGYGEIVKLHIAGSATLFADLARTLDAEGFHNARTGELIRASLEVKKRVIEIDEFDNGLRQTLNYGHTFGHALEAITHHAIPHGLAVAWGLDLVNYLACRMGMFAHSDLDEIHALLKKHFAWRLPAPIDPAALIAATRRDKKVKNGKLTLILPRAIGALEIVPQDFTAELEAAIGDYIRGQSIVTTT